MISANQGEHETYHVIVLPRSGSEVLLVPNGEYHILPSVELPRWQRVTENLTVAVRSKWGEEIIALFELPPGDHGSRYVAAEHLRTRRGSKMPTCWIPASAVTRDLLIAPGNFAAIEKAMKSCKGEMGGACGPFARLGWFSDLRTWIESIVEPIGLHLTGEFRQLNASSSFSLIRFETHDQALWFKAVCQPNLREFAITRELAQNLPDYLPQILATRPDWNGWLSQEVRGKLLSEVQQLAFWERAARDLAAMQIQSIDRGSQILAAGAYDLGSAALSNLIQPFLLRIALLMEQQPKVPPPVLDREDLLGLADSLQDAVEAMDTAGIPDTLGQLDLNPGNIIVSSGRCAFLDWAEAYVGNPLFSLEYLIQHALRAFGEDSDVRSILTAAYCVEWGNVALTGAIADAQRLAPLLALFAYAAGAEAWRNPQELQDPTAGYLRSLARRMHREARELADRRTLCPQ